MITNMEEAISEFLKYTKNFDLNEKHIMRKRDHSIRVMNISEKIAKNSGLSIEDVELAKLIGLLHDIARFEQYTQYQTFKDFMSFDHGDYALTILDNDMRKYIKTDKYDKLIRCAIKNHNKYRIEDGLNDREKLFAKLIRDADKIDILYESIDVFWTTNDEKMEILSISEENMQSFRECQLIKRKEVKDTKKVDDVLLILSLIFDINFKASYNILKQERYVDRFIERFQLLDEETKNRIDEIQKIVNNYISEKLK